jgi:hypothetical protein
MGTFFTPIYTIYIKIEQMSDRQAASMYECRSSGGGGRGAGVQQEGFPQAVFPMTHLKGGRVLRRTAFIKQRRVEDACTFPPAGLEFSAGVFTTDSGVFRWMTPTGICLLANSYELQCMGRMYRIVCYISNAINCVETSTN